jgi:DNA mismatch repair protein MutS
MTGPDPPRRAHEPEAAGAASFRSILFERPDPDVVDELEEPGFFRDLNLDQVVASVTVEREEYRLGPFFYAPLHKVDAVRYRQEVLHDLENADVASAVDRFAGGMREVRGHLAQVDKLHYLLQKQAWFVDAVEVYVRTVGALADELAPLEIGSRGLQGLQGYLGDYMESERFEPLEAETQALKAAVSGVRYSLRIHGARVTVSRYGGEPDYGAEVLETFARFKQGAVKSYLVSLQDWAEMNHVEAQILDLVAKLHPEVFEPVAEFWEHRRDFVDATIARFDREVQFYLAYLELVAPLRRAGLPFCYPRVSSRSKDVEAEGTFDLALADKLVRERRGVVCNDFFLKGPERMFVVTGPNNGGKTTFARTFGQLHHLASLGLLVPGASARLFLPDRIFTHFEQEEDIETLRGKFEDELTRVHEILAQASPNSVIVMNESFNSTTLNDALFVGTEVMERILELGSLGVYVTFVDELASLGEATVSMVSQVVPDNPAQRTFKVLRTPADGLAYAWAIAEKYGLTYDRLVERIGS